MDSFIEVSRLFHLPKEVFNVLELLAGILISDDRLSNSVATIDTYIKRMVEGSKANAESYSSRLLDQGISAGETRSQCKDLLFAGRDSTAMNIATLCWPLAKHPHMGEINTEEKFTSRLLTMGRYETLRMEVMDLRNLQVDPQALPYFSGVDKDGLRLAMASPTRLPRKVPASGMNVQGYYFPRSTNVGHGSFQFHLNPEVFPDPESFIPARWLSPTSEMQRDWVPFGMGPRGCIARNLAMSLIFAAIKKLAQGDVLGKAEVVEDRIEIYEWYNAKVVLGGYH